MPSIRLVLAIAFLISIVSAVRLSPQNTWLDNFFMSPFLAGCSIIFQGTALLSSFVLKEASLRYAARTFFN